MSLKPLASLPRIPREKLSTLLLSPDAARIAVVDVRTDDHVGGHIKDSVHAPSTSLDHKIPEIVRTLADKEIVVFHCALSQERGPRAARRYMEERERKVEKGEMGIGTGEGSGDGEKRKEQEVFVLDKGFVGWQEKSATLLDLALLGSVS